MARSRRRGQDAARVALGAIRLANGAAALAAPEMFARRLGVDPRENGPALYVLRLFGIRTVLLGIALLGRDRGRRERALSDAPLVHVTDAAAAAVAGAMGHLPRRAATTAAAVSTVNVALALAAQRGRPRA